MGISIDVPGTISDDLSTLIEAELNDADSVKPTTLSSVHGAMQTGLLKRLRELDLIEAETDQPLYDEIKGLIEEYGPGTLAQGFVRLRASDDLATLIRAVMAREDRDSPPTLITVREAMLSGQVAELVGEGEIDPDDDDTLLAEIDNLIRKHGEDEPAEDFLP